MEGGCYCKKIRFTVDEEPTWVGACHCIDCRRISGTPYTVWAGYRNDAFKITRGSPEEFQSSAKVKRSFCSACHSPCAFVYTDPNVTVEDNLTYIAIGILDDPTRLKLMQHIWVSQKLPWIDINDGVPQREE